MASAQNSRIEGLLETGSRGSELKLGVGARQCDAGNPFKVWAAVGEKDELVGREVREELRGCVGSALHGDAQFSKNRNENSTGRLTVSPVLRPRNEGQRSGDL